MALEPYFRERYIKNHTMMTMVDQSPNIFSFGSVIEVINELELLKKGIVATAGSCGSLIGTPMGWGKLANGVEGLYGAARVVQTLGGHIKSIFSDGVQSLPMEGRH